MQCYGSGRVWQVLCLLCQVGKWRMLTYAQADAARMLKHIASVWQVLCLLGQLCHALVEAFISTLCLLCQVCHALVAALISMLSLLQYAMYATFCSMPGLPILRCLLQYARYATFWLPVMPVKALFSLA